MVDISPYAAPQMIADPQKLAAAYQYLNSNIEDPDRRRQIAAFNASNPDQQAQLQYMLSIAGHNDVDRYNQYIQQSPWMVAAPPDSATNAPVEVDASKLALAKQAAMQRAELNLRAQGLDPALYMDQIGAEYDKVAQTAGLSNDPYSVFGDDIATNVVKAQNAAQEQQFIKEFEGKFGTAADQQALPSNILDDAINNILGEQKTEAQLQLERGKARGIYNDVGYNAGQSALGTAESAARSELGALGSGYVDQWRGNLNDIDSRAWSASQAFPYGSSTFSLDPYIAERNDFLDRTKANAEGTLRGGLGGRNFFDFGKIGQKAGTAQGALNLRDTDVATAINERKRQNTMSRGLGSQGAF